MSPAGESLAYIKEQLGHHSIKVTVDVCGHLAPEGNKDAVEKLDDSPKTATICILSPIPIKLDCPRIENMGLIGYTKIFSDNFVFITVPLIISTMS